MVNRRQFLSWMGGVAAARALGAAPPKKLSYPGNNPSGTVRQDWVYTRGLDARMEILAWGSRDLGASDGRVVD